MSVLPEIAALAVACAPLVHPRTTLALVDVESSGNPYAIGVVGGELARQPRSAAEAIATARELSRAGRNFSMGLAQINVRNLQRLGLSLESAFHPCSNLAGMQQVLTDCLARSGRDRARDSSALREALSCYYSGNFTTGFRHGYVQRVARSAASIGSSKREQ